ncbi:hypothetical protein QN382_06635 [Pseudomonas sp. 10B1]|nr:MULTISPECIES: hypothetical protein [unclassified Pseudomonas]MEB0246863.1 hypothetical protein [Pseudomonas sp. 10S5]MEA9978298.1 hypothetical protein [Pseudomonas sp. RTS4]MEB0086953.1 hypothetical protein [Pseudomonas sp. RTI1]MEB0126780.1 hypothetical protein [Pseudomonas sp. CCC1.2]MEB0180414.1 hypothetical protein [Pseudomonas sp. CCC3.2]
MSVRGKQDPNDQVSVGALDVALLIEVLVLNYFRVSERRQQACQADAQS